MLQLLKDIWNVRTLRRRLEWHEDFLMQLKLARGTDENVVLLLPGQHRFQHEKLPKMRAIFVSSGACLYMTGCTFGVYPSEIHEETEARIERITNVP